MMCRLLEVSRNGYYKWLNRRGSEPDPDSPRGKRQAAQAEVVRLFEHHNKRGGARTIRGDLLEGGIALSAYAVRKIMKSLRLHTKYRKPRIGSRPCRQERVDLVKRQFNPVVPTTVLCGDITYLRTREGWLYLATVIDLATRMVVGWSIDKHLDSTLVVNAVKMAKSRGYVAGGAIFHSDRGAQYTSNALADYAKDNDIRLSVGRTGVCWDNAVAEAFFSTLKLHCEEYVNQADRWVARHQIIEWIETYYNRARRHTTTQQIPHQHMTRFLNPTTNQTKLAA